MISMKPGVRTFDCLQTETMLGIIIAASVLEKYGYDLTITSVADGKHGPKSLHYAGYAFDFRTRMMRDGDKQIVASAVSKALGDEYDVVAEKTHIHVEYDPD